jgi:hypothetical protein
MYHYFHDIRVYFLTDLSQTLLWPARQSQVMVPTQRTVVLAGVTLVAVVAAATVGLGPTTAAVVGGDKATVTNVVDGDDGGRRRTQPDCHCGHDGDERYAREHHRSLCRYHHLGLPGGPRHGL